MTIRCFVAGWPVSHSLSPILHGYWIEKYGLEGSYEPKAVQPADFKDFLINIDALGYAGGNVTLPFKREAFELVSKRDSEAEAIGAVNTVWLEKGKITGGNTDAYGFEANMDDNAPQWRDAKTALVLGAGGASPAIVHALLKTGISHVHLANRTVERAKTMAEHYGPNVSYSSLNDLTKVTGKADLVVNTTSHGMGKGADIEPIIALENFKPHTIVADIVYAPLETPFLASAKNAGLRTVDGLGMLLHQAVPGFEIWFGTRPKVDGDLRAHITERVNLT